MLSKTQNILCRFIFVVQIVLMQFDGFSQSNRDAINLLDKHIYDSIWQRENSEIRSRLLLKNKTITVGNNTSLINSLVYYDKRLKSKISNCTINLNNSLSIDNCHIVCDTLIESEMDILCNYDSSISFNLNNELSIHSSKFPDNYNFYLPDNRDNVYLFDNSFGSITGSFSQRSLITNNNNFSGDINISKSDAIDLITLAGSHFNNAEGNSINVSDSKINAFLLVDCVGKKINLNFYYDTIMAAVSIFHNNKIPEEERTKANLYLNFYKCQINGSLTSSYIAPKSKVTFEECSFGSNANLSDIAFDTIVFKNCFNIPNPVLLSFNSNVVHPCISFINSNVTNLKFDFTDKIILFFDSASKGNPDIVSGTYENLLAKYEVEGKNESFKNVDIVYTKFQNKLNGIGGFIKDIVSRYWWYYGYRKFYILYWTLGFLLLFYIINLLKWKSVQKVYAVIPDERQSYFDKANQSKEKKSRYYLNVFIYTAFIFFSLKIDFDKLSYNRSRLLVYFFFQYMVGLICMFFLANAIFKI